MAMPVPTQAIDVMSLTLMALVNLVNLGVSLFTCDVTLFHIVIIVQLSSEHVYIQKLCTCMMVYVVLH